MFIISNMKVKCNAGVHLVSVIVRVRGSGCAGEKERGDLYIHVFNFQFQTNCLGVKTF